MAPLIQKQRSSTPLSTNKASSSSQEQLINQLLSSLQPNGAAPPTKQEETKSKFEETEIIAYYESQLKLAQGDRAPYERQWWLNLAFYMGKHWFQWVGENSIDSAKLIEPKRDPWTVRLTTNHVRKHVRPEIARLNAEKPRGYIVPATSDDDDTAGARAAEAIHSYLTEGVIDIDSLMWRADFWTVICGTAFVKDYWDAQTKDDSGIPGVVKAIPINPFYIYVPNLEEEEIDKQPWIMHLSVMDPYEVSKMYGVELEPDTTVVMDGLQEKMLRAAGIRSQSARKGVLVKECWVRPCKMYPEGGMFVWCSNQMLYQTASQVYDHGEYPFTRRTHIQTGTFYGASFIEDLIPLNRDYNRARSQLIENRNIMGRPQILSPSGSVTVGKWTSKPGAVIEYSAGLPPPTVLTPASIPAYVQQQMDQTQQDMRDMASQHDATSGYTSNPAQAATAIAALQEADNSAIGYSIRNKEALFQRLGRHLLSYAAQFWDSERMVRVTGEGQAFEAFIFSKSNLGKNIDYRVVAGSALPQSRAAKQAFIMDLMKSGFIPPQKGLQWLAMGETTRLYEEMQRDSRRAQRENLKAQEQTDIEIEDFDDDMIHIYEHDEFRKSEQCENSDPQVRLVLRYHTFQHLQQASVKAGIPVQSNVLSVPQLDGTSLPLQQVDPQKFQGVLQQMQQEGQYYVDPMQEIELRTTYAMLKQTGGMGPVQGGANASTPK